MTPRRQRAIAALVAVASLLSACGLDDGARVRNQDNVREAESTGSGASD